MLLVNSDRFIKDYENFKKRIAAVTDPNVQSTLNNYLAQLMIAVKKIDSLHQELSYISKLTDTVNISREDVMNARRKLVQLLDSWERQNKSDA